MRTGHPQGRDWKKMRRTRMGNLQCPSCRKIYVKDVLKREVTNTAENRYYLECPSCLRPVYWEER